MVRSYWSSGSAGAMEYTRLKCTERVYGAIESADESYDELREWKKSGATSCIPFPLLLNIHKRTKLLLVDAYGQFLVRSL